MAIFASSKGPALFLSVAFVSVSAPALATPAAKNGAIVFVRRDSGSIDQLFTILPTGAGLTQLTFGPTCASGPEDAPDWSPDGNHIADQHFQNSVTLGCSDWEINVANPDGSGVVQITSLGDVGHPRWSPDGSKILCERSASITGASFVVMNADGTNQVTLGAFAGNSATWTPAGKIGYVGASDGCLYTMNADGTGSTKLAAPCHQDGAPDWSPDGTKIVYSASGPACGGYANCRDVYVVNADGTGETSLTAPTASPTGPPDGEYPSWSPDGTQITFQSTNVLPFRIWIMNADGTQQTALTSDRVNFKPRWRPLVAATTLSLPAITGNPMVSSILTATAGAWSGSSPVSYGYQWLRCDAMGASCAAIVSATADMYTLQDADAGATIRVAVTATNGAGSTTSASNPTAIIMSATPSSSDAGVDAGSAMSGNHSGGCTTAGSSPSVLFGLALAALVARRRSRRRDVIVARRR